MYSNAVLLRDQAHNTEVHLYGKLHVIDDEDCVLDLPVR